MLRNRGRKPGRIWRGAAFGFACILLTATPAVAQNPHAGAGSGDVPDVAPGSASITGRLEHPDGAAKTEGSTIVLYALAADGSPGMRSTRADAGGAFSFEGISNAAGITYLIGASYRGVPYGERATFGAGESEISLVIQVDEPASDASRISVANSSLRVTWAGSSLGIEEIHQLENPDEGVVYVPPDEREGKTPAFRTALPQGASAVDTSLSGVADGYAVEDGVLEFWGPIYSGGFELRFRYLIAVPRDREADIALRWPLDTGTRDATVLYAPNGPEVRIPGGPPVRGIQTGDGTLQSYDIGPVIPGRGVEMSVALPSMSGDLSAVTISRADYWLDADDTFLQVNAQVYFEVAPGALLAGSPEAPLMTLDVPDGAELLGASSEAQDLGVIPMPDGSLGILGPLAPGQSGFAYRYRIPVVGTTPALALAHPVPVAMMNVLIADTGVVIETERLHRRRPFKQGTRIYLHREAYSVEAGEEVSIRLGLLDRGSVDPRAHLFATSAFAALGVWFIVSPLTRRQTDGMGEYERARIRSERDIVYQGIRDLEHDHETGKVEGAEYEAMRSELRSKAVALLQREKATEAGATAPDAEASAASEAATAHRHCVQCGAKMQEGWRFCANCGAARPEAEEAPA